MIIYVKAMAKALQKNNDKIKIYVEKKRITDLILY